MEMLLMGVCISLFGLAVTAAAFGAATQSDRMETKPLPEHQPIAKVVPAHFFAEDVVIPAPPAYKVPIEALLLQIDSHVRLEQAAAESFLEYPTTALLHSRTCSPLIQ
ncbi:MAG: hypothetical protein HY821_10235 [Acidobacteria bacterium]|nr:hypothetical protein [Acidobacteriota bacterium]